jgi:hypothetical protein
MALHLPDCEDPPHGIISVIGDGSQNLASD